MVASADDRNWELSPIHTLDEFLTCSPSVALVIAEIAARRPSKNYWRFYHAILDPCFSPLKELGMPRN
jgi:hypothetical protein